MLKVTLKESSRSSSSRRRRTSALTSARRERVARGGAELIQAVTAWRRWRGDLRGPRFEVGWGHGSSPKNFSQTAAFGDEPFPPCRARAFMARNMRSGVARLQVADDEPIRKRPQRDQNRGQDERGRVGTGRFDDEAGYNRRADAREVADKIVDSDP